MQIITLGTSAMVPTKTRNHSAIFLSYDSEGLLFDCGEGTQRQLKLAKIKLTKITRIFISHWHGDHVLGLPGLMQSLVAEEYSKTLHIYGPKNTKQKLKSLNQIFDSDKQLNYEIHEIETENEIKTILDTPDFKIKTVLLEHKTPSFAFSFIEKNKRRMKMNIIKKLNIPEGPLLGKLQRGETIKHKNKTIKPDEVTKIVKGKKITYIADTKTCKNAIDIATESDILIAESTYMQKDTEKAQDYFHMTTIDAAQIALKSDSKKLILTHISQRYKETEDMAKEAQNIFPETIHAFDLMKIKL